MPMQHPLILSAPSFLASSAPPRIRSTLAILLESLLLPVFCFPNQWLEGLKIDEDDGHMIVVTMKTNKAIPAIGEAANFFICNDDLVVNASR